MATSDSTKSPLLDGTRNNYDAVASGGRSHRESLTGFEQNEVEYIAESPEFGGAQGIHPEGEGLDASVEGGHKTTPFQAYIHLMKGFIGVGVLSLPWAFSQTGYVIGFLSVTILSIWTSYNCWTVVRVKRYTEKWQEHHADNDDASVISGSTQLTYPVVGEWAYGSTFQNYVTYCICTQQLAISTVFVSFIGENILAVCRLVPDHVPDLLTSHAGVMSIVLPLVLSLSFFPHLKSLTPVMTAATVLLFTGFGALGYVMARVSNSEEAADERVDISTKPAKIPLAMCAIIYGYEGVCLVLPVETSIDQPKKFKKVFWSAMGTISLIMAIFSVICIWVFGEVTNGSITANLLEKYGRKGLGEESNPSDHVTLIWIMIANTVFTLSILFSYPLMLVPAIELLGPVLTNILSKFMSDAALQMDTEDDDEKDLAGFERMPPLPEHDMAADWSDLDSFHDHEEERQQQEQQQQQQNKDGNNRGEAEDFTPGNFFGRFTGKKENGDDNDNGGGGGGGDEEETTSVISSVTSKFIPRMQSEGDSPPIRLVLVLITFIVATVIPNVEQLVSLAGAIAGSSTALLIPPLLELQLLHHIEVSGGEVQGEEGAQRPTRSVVFGKYWGQELRCYLLFAGGFVFFVIGTYASLSDILETWFG